MNWLYKLERKFGRYGIPDLMRNIVICMAFVYIADMAMVNVDLIGKFSLDMAMVMRGEVWRLITFLFIPPESSVMFIVFALYFYYMIGSALENEWGTFIFNAYYFIGVIGCILTALITGYASSTFLNLSLFFAFAILFPDFELMLFFVIPIKIKYLAILDAVIYVISFVGGSISTKITIVLCLANLAIFFGRDFIRRVKQENSYRKTRRNFRSSNNRDNYFNNRY